MKNLIYLLLAVFMINACDETTVEDPVISYADSISMGAGYANDVYYSLENGTKVCRTYALVQFQAATNVRARDEHASILDGASIGETFKSAGWRIYKQTLYIGSITPASPDADVLQMMRLDDTQELAMHVYQLLIEKEDVALEYATIVEVHHPDYLAESELRDLFPVSESSLLSEDEVTAIVSLVLPPQNH